MRDQSSLTAEYMALFRAIESSRSARSRLFLDPFAPMFLRQWRAGLYGFGRFAPGRWLVEHLLDRSAPGARAAGIARTRWIDDETEQALRTCGQLVLLGAGFDTRAYRLAGACQAHSFEIDHPETSRAKQAALRLGLGSLPEQVRFVGIDFNRQSIAEVLDRAGFDRTKPACFIWEGVTNYLRAEAVDGVLNQIGKASPGSVLLFTYIHRGVLDHPERFFGAQKLMSRLQSYGEPWIFGFHPEELPKHLEARGLRLIKDLSVAEVWQRAGRPRGEASGYEFYRLASASVPGQTADGG
jgi:methyltransferase (TIGR00027 family)